MLALPRAAAGSLCVCLLLGLCGCDDGRIKRYPTRGTVTFVDGEPLSGGSVIFRSVEHGIRARGRVGTDGVYRLSTYEERDGAVEGKHQVMVLPVFDRHDGTSSKPVHRRYQSIRTSELEFAVTPSGPNVFDIQVEPP